jgi:hypothetical protein
MTSQFAVLNSLGVAIASDTVSSIVNADGDILKTNQNVEKLFEIGPNHKVIVAISGSLELDNAPISLLLSEWAASISGSFQTLNLYRTEFCKWLDANFIRFSHNPTKDLLAGITSSVYEELRNRADQSWLSSDDPNESLEEHFERELHAMLQEHLESKDFLTNFEQVLTQLDECQVVISHLLITINEGHLQLQTSTIDLFADLVQLCIIKSSELLDAFGTEIAFVGFGESDLYAGSISFKTIGHIGGALVEVGQREMTLDESSHSSAFIGFAQLDAIASFLHGISPATRRGISDFVVDHFSKFEISDEEFENFRVAFQEFGDQFAEENYYGQLLESISSLSLVDLCSLARSLVEMQALRSSNGNAPASVGGFIESLVIDRRQGVRWSTKLKSV